VLLLVINQSRNTILMYPGPTNLITDVPGIQVGNSHDPDLRSGVTVITPTHPSIASADLRGGGTGTRDVALLSPEGTIEKIDSIVLSGGSAYGLDAAGGVMNYLRQQNRGVPIRSTRVPIVAQAILFDQLNGGNKDWGSTPPFWQLGYDAAINEGKSFDLGNSGAGYGAIAGDLKGGLGSASIFIPELEITVGALAAVNSAGSVIMPGDRAFYAWDSELKDEFGGLIPTSKFERSLVIIPEVAHLGENTTLAVIATDAILNKMQTRRLAITSQNGMGRAIRPSHTPLDGDMVFAIATGSKELKDPIRDLAVIGGHAANCLARAIARGVYEAETIGDLKAYRDAFKN